MREKELTCLGCKLNSSFGVDYCFVEISVSGSLWLDPNLILVSKSCQNEMESGIDFIQPVKFGLSSVELHLTCLDLFSGWPAAMMIAKTQGNTLSGPNGPLCCRLQRRLGRLGYHGEKL